MSKYAISRADLAEGVAYMTAYMRLKSGWSYDRAVSVPARVRKVKANKPGGNRRYSPRAVESYVPPRIRRARAALCDEFVKTGELNAELHGILKDYADECRAANEHPQGIPDEPQAPRRHRRPNDAGDISRGGGVRLDTGAAERIANFLRAE